MAARFSSRQEMIIRNLATVASLPKTKSAIKLHKKSRSSILRLNKKTKRRATRYGILFANFALLATVAFFILDVNHSDKTSATSVKSNSQSIFSIEKAKPLDNVSSADIAVNIARVTGMPESTSVVNKADTVSAQLAVATSNESVAAKPQIVGAGLKSKKDIKKYKAVTGDTVATVADKFGVSQDTIRASNNIVGTVIDPGKEVLISPINGIVYKVNNGDTPDSVASKFKANKDNLVVFNDVESTNKLVAGDLIVVPDGVLPVAPPTTSRRSSTATTNTTAYGGGFSFGITPVYGGNGYDYGWCTWGVANLISVPRNWGNASAWAINARLSGWNVSTVPTVGAIAQRGGGAGHVGIVIDVSADGSQIRYKDMNGIAGWGRYGESGWVSKTTYQYFITH